MSNSYKIILVDDHEMVRSAFKEMIEHAGPYKVVEEFSSGKDFILAQPAKLSADLLILDLSMPGMDGRKVIDWLKDNNIELKTLVVTMESSDESIAKLFRDGIRGYLRKQSPSSELKKAISDILEFGYYHNEVLMKVIKGPDTELKNSTGAILERITDKELQFLRLICDEEEYTYDQICDILHVHRRTLDNYRASLFEKFNIKSKSGLVMFAMKHNLLEDHEL